MKNKNLILALSLTLSSMAFANSSVIIGRAGSGFRDRPNAQVVKGMKFYNEDLAPIVMASAYNQGQAETAQYVLNVIHADKIPDFAQRNLILELEKIISNSKENQAVAIQYGNAILDFTFGKSSSIFKMETSLKSPLVIE